MKRLRRAGLLAGIAVGVTIVAASPALAQNDCGAPTAGTVTCTAAGNPYANGVTYNQPSAITVTTTSDSRVTNTLSVTSTGGSATVTAAGPVATTAAGATGIAATATGNVSVTATSVATTGANAAGIIATSSGGTVTITSTAVAVATAGGPGILATGMAGVSITSGTGSAIDNAAIYAVSRDGPVALAITGATSAATGATGSDAAVVASSGTTNTITIASGATVTGNNAFTLSSATGSTVTNAGTLNGANGYAVQVNRGTATITNTGTLTGRINFLGNNTAATNSSFVNSGTFNVTGFSLFGLGTPTLTNTGTIQVLSSAPTDGSVAFTSLSSLTNGGTISMANGRAGDVLTVPGTFVASGASTLALDVKPGTNAAPADKLIIGGAATGTTTVTLTNLNGTAGLLPGTVVVQAGAGTTASAFQLAAGSTTSGFGTYSLVFNAAANSFTLYGLPAVTAYRPLKLIEGARNVANQTAHLWSALMRDRRDAPEAHGRFWLSALGGRQDRDDVEQTSVFGQAAVQDLSYHQDYYGVQAGIDVIGVPGRTGFVVGITGGYTYSRLAFDGQAARASYDVLNIGGYASFGIGPLSVDLLGKYDSYRVRFTDPAAGFAARPRGNGGTGMIEVSYRGGMGGLFVEPAVSATYTNVTLPALAGLGSVFDLRTANSVRGRAGLRLGKLLPGPGRPISIYVGGNAVKEFGDRDELLYSNSNTTLLFQGRRVPLYGEAYAGANFGGHGPLTGFIEGTGSFGGATALTGGGGRAGLRFSF